MKESTIYAKGSMPDKMSNKYKTLAIAKPSCGEFVTPGADFSLLTSVTIKINFECVLILKKEGRRKVNPEGLTSTWWSICGREMGFGVTKARASKRGLNADPK